MKWEGLRKIEKRWSVSDGPKGALAAGVVRWKDCDTIALYDLSRTAYQAGFYLYFCYIIQFDYYNREASTRSLVSASGLAVKLRILSSTDSGKPYANGPLSGPLVFLTVHV